MLLIATTLSAEERVLPPAPVMPIPTARQLAWQRRELAMFVHFTVNTFTDREWGLGTEAESVFNPSALDAGQWARIARETGFRSVVLTAKHHDGFCLWPSPFTGHTVAQSPWKGGQGDVVADLASACRREGLELGLYLSPWDRHEPVYGDERLYNEFYLGQLRELLTGYGSLSEVWFDGAKGEDAKDMNYHFDQFWALVRQLQPGAVMFSDAGPDVRWIGNERGAAGETCWSMMDRSKVAIGKADTQYLNQGDLNGPDWVPGETDVSIRKGWFWHPNENPKSAEELLDIYFQSVGRNTVLLLNVPPNRAGLIDEKDIVSLREFHRRLAVIFGSNAAGNAKATASSQRGGNARYGAEQTLDNNPDTYWATDDDQLTAQLELRFDAPVEFNVIRIEEPIQLGQRIKAYRVEALVGGKWMPASSGSTVGYRKLDRCARVKAEALRLTILDSRGCPLVSEIGVHLDPQR